jgi:hypothetical protein
MNYSHLKFGLNSRKRQNTFVLRSQTIILNDKVINENVVTNCRRKLSLHILTYYMVIYLEILSKITRKLNQIRYLSRDSTRAMSE